MRRILTPTLAMALLLCFVAGCNKTKSTTPAPVPVVLIPSRTPVRLEIATIENFVDWVSTMPVSQVPEVKKQIALVAANNSLVEAVAAKLSFQSNEPMNRQLIYLSILGETKNEHALVPLRNYMNARDCPVFEERKVLDEPLPTRVVASPHTSYFDYCAGLKSAAINMIAYINSQAAQKVVLQAIHDHPSRAVRISGMNSFLYNQHDSAEAIALVRRYARTDEVKLVGLPRLAAGSDRKDFVERFTRFYEDHPEERPQLPGNVAPSTGNARVTTHAHSALRPAPAEGGSR